MISQYDNVKMQKGLPFGLIKKANIFDMGKYLFVTLVPCGFMLNNENINIYIYIMPLD
jgi:hypothetical protein